MKLGQVSDVDSHVAEDPDKAGGLKFGRDMNIRGLAGEFLWLSIEQAEELRRRLGATLAPRDGPEIR